MKKSILSIMLVIALAMTSFAGGLLTNSNQSAQFVRMLSRNASTQIDAVYYNPAGLIQLENGWHFALNNQSIFQEKSVNSGFPLLNDGEYIGKVNAPIFPSGFAVYKMDKLAFSLGFGPNAGGGSADFERGLPSFEIPITQLGAGLVKIAPLLAPYQIPGATGKGYDADLSFEGNSVFWGIQVGASYKLNNYISLSGGVRIISSRNNYTGSINNITIKTTAGDMPASVYLNTINPVLTGTISTINTAADALNAAIQAGAGGASVTNAQMLQLLGALGKTTPTTNQEAYSLFTATSAQLTGLKSANVADKKVETIQKGTGLAPILGLNITPVENLNISARYEFKTRLELTNNTEVDDLGLFPDKAKSGSDLPAIFAAGIGYKPLEWIEAQVSYSLYFDKNVDWGKNVRDIAVYKSIDPTKIRQREIDKNYYELAFGLQFDVAENLAVSLGCMTSQPGIADSYQSDFSYNNPSSSLAGGIQWNVTDHLTLDAGILNTFYKDEKVTFTHPSTPNYNDTLGKTSLNIAFGLSYSIF